MEGTISFHEIHIDIYIDSLCFYVIFLTEYSCSILLSAVTLHSSCSLQDLMIQPLYHGMYREPGFSATSKEQIFENALYESG